MFTKAQGAAAVTREGGLRLQERAGSALRTNPKVRGEGIGCSTTSEKISRALAYEALAVGWRRSALPALNLRNWRRTNDLLLFSALMSASIYPMNYKRYRVQGDRRTKKQSNQRCSPSGSPSSSPAARMRLTPPPRVPRRPRVSVPGAPSSSGK